MGWREYTCNGGVAQIFLAGAVSKVFLNANYPSLSHDCIGWLPDKLFFYLTTRRIRAVTWGWLSDKLFSPEDAKNIKKPVKRT
ncbi:hypothetical protein D0T49_09670 [Paludibacter sp. 221]|uniref:hypothetical protein n=1 Tax=Paludibacter sp. 221 TaxID=2302939 RepID=UPI0013D65CD1|nr:hypothetical protein [Paludibacter sp. 221]NDV47312.1 hypothetical protein [Paludibacter sp. 221]